MKATIYMATYDKNDLLPNTLYSIVRQEVPFSYEVCIIDDCSPVDPEPIIREFIPDAKYKRLEKQAGFDVVTTYALDLASPDSDILIMQSADIIHGQENTIEQLCNGVGHKKICMALVRNTNPPEDMYKNFDKHLPKIIKSWKKGQRRNKPGGIRPSYFFFLGAIRRKDYESLDCIKSAHCDNMLSKELMRKNFEVYYPEGLMGFHQQHPITTVPCTRLTTCDRESCNLKKRCFAKGWRSFEDYLKWKENQK